MNWVSLAKTEGTSRVVIVDAPHEGGDPKRMMAGLTFVRDRVTNKELTMRCLETKERIRIKLSEDMRNMPLPGYWINEELELV